MKTYADANLLVRIYLQLPEREAALEKLTAADTRSGTPLPMTDLLRFEVLNAIHRMVFESRTGGHWRVTVESAAAALAEFGEHLEEGLFIKRVPLALAEIESEFEMLVARHTASGGFRTYDVIHVASALALGCERFLSFDARAIALAKLAGLRVK
jgi:predicted nucleic acid-binding protein